MGIERSATGAVICHPPFLYWKDGFLRTLTFVVAACVLSAGCERTGQPVPNAGLVVRDDAGRTLGLPRPAVRIVSLMPTVTDLVIAMGHADRLIARTDYDTDARVQHLPSIGGGLTPSVEWLAAQKPDLVVSWPDNPARSLVSKLEAVGIPVYAARTDTIANTLTMIRNLGVLLNAERSADSLARAITGALDSVRVSVRGRERVRVAYVIWLKPPTIAGPGTFIDELIRVAGGENVFADGRRLYLEVSLEELIQRDPDVVVLARETTDDAQRSLGMSPGWRDLRAVRAGRVLRVSPGYFNRSGPLMPRAARELAQFFHESR
ncbi:MAG: ABC transporter substrate-binding protein [Gemmatimonadota bacterium]